MIAPDAEPEPGTSPSSTPPSDADVNGEPAGVNGEPADVNGEPAGVNGYRGWLDHLGGISDPLGTREGQLDRLLTVTGEVVGGELEPEIALRRLSEAAERFIAHHGVDIGWIEDGQSYCSLQQMAGLPESERPGEMETIDRSGLAAVMRDGQPLIVDDLQASPWKERLSARKLRQAVQAGARAALIVPMRLGRRITGMLEFHHHEAGVYTQADLVMAARIAEQISPVVEALHLYKREELVRRQLETIFETSQAISASLDLEQTLPVVGRSLTRALTLPTCAIYLYDESRQALVPRAAYSGADDQELKEAARADAALETIERAFYQYSFPLNEPLGALMNDLRRPLVIDNPAQFRGIPPDFLAAVPFAAVMQVPLVVRDRLVGMAALPVWEAGQGFTERQLKLAMGIAQSAAVAIEHAQLYARARELGMAEERNRLAREVHDTLAQGLTAITLQLEAAERLMPPGAEANRLVGEARSLARRSLAEARRAVWGLAPSPLDGRSLAEALADEVAGFGRRTGLTATFAARGEPPKVPGEQAAAILRVVQEALHNVEKHAQASRVRVELEYLQTSEARHLQFLVADDGVGFDPTEAHAGEIRADGGGFGLTSMQERMRLIGGRLDVESAPGWGARIRGQAALSDERRPDAPGYVGPASTEAVRVLLVDDHPLAREGIRRLLDGRPDVAVMGEAEDGVEGVERALALRPDVVLMDLQMPRLSGVGAIQALREQWPEARVLILTTFAQDEHLFEALRAGARGYLLKDAGPDELAAAIKTVHQGGSLVQPVMASRLLDRFGELATRERLPELLTEREIEVLRLAASGARNREIAERLTVTEKTIKYHLGQAYAKLGVTGRTEAVARARELGVIPLDAHALA
ncbi:MAG: response regulator [Chloroflexi bacterium]|nr:response regulator [Chloroflexota bacterium]